METTEYIEFIMVSWSQLLFYTLVATIVLGLAEWSVRMFFRVRKAKRQVPFFFYQGEYAQDNRLRLIHWQYRIWKYWHDRQYKQ